MTTRNHLPKTASAYRLVALASSFVVGCAAAFAFANVATAATISRSNDDAGAIAGVDRVFGVPTYWTPERMQNAVPRDVPVDEAAAASFDSDADSSGDRSSASGPAGRPLPGMRPNPTQLFEPLASVEGPSLASGLERPAARGTAKYHFTSSRILPASGDRVHPYRAVGKLFYTKPGGGDFVCSATVLRPRIILTAGHCVHSGRNGNSGFFRNFMFVPAYRNGAAPFGTWDWGWVTTTTTWSTGGGSVPNAADYAIIEMRDQRIGGRNTKIGDRTGWMGWKTNAGHPNHFHALGYPVNLDKGQRLHQVSAQSQGNFGTNTVRYGSDMRGGSSGGPIVQNLGQRATGQTFGQNRGLNQIVGVISSIPTGKAVLYSSTSRLDSRFTTLVNRACNHRAGNC